MWLKPMFSQGQPSFNGLEMRTELPTIRATNRLIRLPATRQNFRMQRSRAWSLLRAAVREKTLEEALRNGDEILRRAEEAEECDLLKPLVDAGRNLSSS